MKKPIMSLPCKMRLEDLNANRLGYHCQLCDKHITDFRGKSTTEIVQTIQKSLGKVCGIFSNGQTDYKTAHIPLPRFTQKIGLSLLGILGFMGPLLTGCEQESADQTALKLDAFRKLKFPLDLNGMLRDQTTGKPIPNASVCLQQNGKTILETVTNDNGYFTFFVQRKDLNRETFDLSFQASGYTSDTLTDFFQTGSSDKRIRLTVSAAPSACEKVLIFEQTVTTGDVMVSGIESSEPAIEPEPPILMGKPMIDLQPLNGAKDHSIEKERAVFPKKRHVCNKDTPSD